MFERIKNLFRKAGGKLGMVESLVHVADHPKIGVNPKEYERIWENVKHYKGEYPQVERKNYYGDLIESPYMSLNMLQLTSWRLASLLFNEKCKITISEAAAQRQIDEWLRDNDFYKNFTNYLPNALAIGGVYMRPYISGDKVKIGWGQANNFYPLKANSNNISEAAIVMNSEKLIGNQTYYYTLLEFHEWEGSDYVISYELYCSSDKSEVGNKVPLKEAYPDLKERRAIEGLTRPLFVYLRPAGGNNIDLTSPLALGICDNAKTTLKQINDTYDAMHYEIRTAERKILLSDDFVDVKYEGLKSPPKRVLDDSSMFVPVPGRMDEVVHKDISFEMRAQPYIEAINFFIRMLEMQLSISPGTFSFDGRSVKSATEIVSENSMTYQTRNSHIVMVEKAIKELIISMCELGRFSGLYNGPLEFEINIDFDDGVFVDKDAQLSYHGRAVTFGLEPKAEAIQKIFSVDKSTAAKWLAAIEKEQRGNTDPPDPEESLLSPKRE